MPRTILPAASRPMPQIIEAGDSCACSVLSVAGPRKTALVAFAPRKTVPRLAAHATIAGTAYPACSAAAYSIHLLAKPLIRGMPIMLPAPTSQETVVAG